MKRLLVAAALTMLLAGCQDNNMTYENYMLHPEKVPAKLEACRQMSDMQITNDQSCIAAIKSRRAIASLLKELEADPQAYGAKIMQMQIQYANLQTHIHNASKADPKLLAKLQQQAKDLKYHIDVYRGVIRLVGG